MVQKLNKVQKWMILEFVENNEIIGHIKHTKESAALWREFSLKLNECGPSKTWKEWRKAWHDIKIATKAKISALGLELGTNGSSNSTKTKESALGLEWKTNISGYPPENDLTEYQKRIYSLLIRNPGLGQKNTKESEVKGQVEPPLTLLISRNVPSPVTSPTVLPPTISSTVSSSSLSQVLSDSPNQLPNPITNLTQTTSITSPIGLASTEKSTVLSKTTSPNAIPTSGHKKSSKPQQTTLSKKLGIFEDDSRLQMLLRLSEKMTHAEHRKRDHKERRLAAQERNIQLKEERLSLERRRLELEERRMTLEENKHKRQEEVIHLLSDILYEIKKEI